MLSLLMSVSYNSGRDNEMGDLGFSVLAIF